MYIQIIYRHEGKSYFQFVFFVHKIRFEGSYQAIIIFVVFFHKKIYMYLQYLWKRLDRVQFAPFEFFIC